MSDLISRQVAIDAVQGIGRLATLPDNDAVVRMSAVEYVLFNLPSAQPERKKGRWKRLIVPCNPDKGGFTQTKYECSECGEEATISWLNMYDLSNFCPNCGAQMMQEGESNDK